MPEGVVMSLGVKSPPRYSKPFEEWLVKARLLVPCWGALARCWKGQQAWDSEPKCDAEEAWAQGGVV